MALIPKYHTTVAMFPVDPADVLALNNGSTESTYWIVAGMAVGLNSSGYVKKASNSVLPIGLAGDSLAVSAGHNAYQDSILVSAAGTKKSSQNRISDYFNETLGSGLLSVYTGTGQFWSDMFVAGASFTVGSAIKASNANPGFFDVSGTPTVGICTSGPVVYPSGVPGVDGGSSSDYSMGLNSYNGTGFISFLMQL
jgi:hypothetical protein